MYSYQHRYHAGNFADLHKHLILVALLTALRQKDTAFWVLDAFAGEGIYDLNSQESQKNKEYLSGVSQITKLAAVIPELQELLNLAISYQVATNSYIYPGSPAIIKAKLRLQDRAILIENHPQAFAKLRNYFAKNKQIHLHKRDAMEAILALVPFANNRGLIFLDPSYEVKTEYQTIGTIIQQAYKKFQQGVYMVWYPLLRETKQHLALLKMLPQVTTNIWQHEWLPKHNTVGMVGSGVVILNPPWQFRQTIELSLKFLANN